LGKEQVDKIGRLRVLLVGAGGIGCEVAKNLAKMEVTALTILDFDSIEETNLNRQFYFRKQHIGQSKATVIKQELQRYAPRLKITSICDTLYNPRFNSSFYSQFDILISALDNLKAREHLSAQASRHKKPMIDAGTMSYHGQAYATIRFLTTCHNCEPLRVEAETGAACLVRTRP
jgi:ubiquitin-like 1-activating enzyme E1 B